MVVDEAGDVWVCTKCKEARPDSDFYHHADGRRKNPCRICCRARGRERYYSTPESERRVRAKATWAKYYATHRDELVDAQRNKYHAKGRVDRLRRHKLTPERYAEMLAAQGGACALCDTPETETVEGILFVDHCHESGDIRWLLCNRCNRGIGLFREHPEILRRAADMLEAHRASR